MNEVKRMEKTINVKGMHCKSCEMLIADSLGEISGVANVKIDHKKGTVNFSYEREEAVAEVKKAIEKEGYKVVG
ncbi:Heavy-metal-associated domain protein [Candidatus Gugararchaeum adminiculabundum]|nr:Heavy-metal-associated domain protein [Candidatus Gugararchaeum adminiculabundum]